MFLLVKRVTRKISVVHATKSFNLIPKNADFIFSTDMYHEHSIKSMERSRHGSGEKLLIKRENTRKPRDWKTFLSNADNKRHLICLAESMGIRQIGI